MFTKRLLFCFIFNSIMLLLIPAFAYGQQKDSLLTEKGISTETFQKVLVDGHVAYHNKQTNEFLSQLEYTALFDSMTTEKKNPDTNYVAPILPDPYWDNDKVNPYMDVSLPVPFKVEFDQSTFTYPIDGDIVVTSRYGRRRRGPHRGIDLDLVTGDSVRAVLPGKVRFAKYSRGHGKTVVVRHANDVETVYAHLSAYLVEANDSIAEGQVLGLGGNTGNSRGSHLHLEVRYKGVCIHPEYVFSFDGSSSIRGSELWVSNAWQSPKLHSSYRKSEVAPLFTEQEAIAAQNAEPRYHRVQSGDTLSHIAQRYHLGLSELCRLNALSRTAILRIGQTIKVR